VLLDLKIKNELVFRLDGVETPAIHLSAGAVVASNRRVEITSFRSDHPGVELPELWRRG
jgi:hypothetical protein